jgi:hypothetical protein
VFPRKSIDILLYHADPSLLLNHDGEPCAPDGLYEYVGVETY